MSQEQYNTVAKVVDEYKSLKRYLNPNAVLMVHQQAQDEFVAYVEIPSLSKNEDGEQEKIFLYVGVNKQGSEGIQKKVYTNPSSAHSELRKAADNEPVVILTEYTLPYQVKERSKEEEKKADSKPATTKKTTSNKNKTGEKKKDDIPF